MDAFRFVRSHQFAWVLSALIPIVLPHPQILTGTLVNALIVYSACRFSLSQSWPILVLPSLAAAFMGMILARPILLVLIPAIWVGNTILFSLVKRSPFLAVALKGLWLWVFAFAANMPPQVLWAMGPMQVITASLGVVVGLGLTHVF